MQEFVITQTIVDIGNLSILLIEKINELDEVILGKILTGSLQSDLENSDAKTEIDFYDLGIPGNTNLPLTQNEQKLHDADGTPWGSVGLGFSVNFHKLLNRVSGRTKKLRKIVEIYSNGYSNVKIEAEILKLENGQEIVDALKKSKVETDKAKTTLLDSEKGRKVLAASIEARDLIDEFSSWADENIAGLKIKNKSTP